MANHITQLFEKLKKRWLESDPSSSPSTHRDVHPLPQCCVKCETLVRAMHQSANSTKNKNTVEQSERARHEGDFNGLYRWLEFEKTISAGCPVCAVLKDAVSSFLEDGSAETASFEVVWNPRKQSPWTFRLSMDLNIESDQGYSPLFRVDVHAPENPALCAWPLARPPFCNSAEATLAQAKRWLRDCRENHAGCLLDGYGIDEEATPLPKRVLDVSSPDGEIRLCETEEMKMVGRYTCLSHCWGGSQPLTTTRSTLEERKRAIAWDMIPQTFQDAIVVTRNLGVRFLWIDSLCIVQDDRNDWTEQAPAMCTIYRNAYLTIAATRSAGCHDTLFPSLDRRVYGVDENGKSLEVVLRAKCRHLLPSYYAELTYPFLKRAWIFQERLLSRRVLHFGFDEVFWECMETATCQCPPEDISDRDLKMDIKSVCYRRLGRPDVTLATRQPSQQWIWYELVSVYTRLNLTYPSDRPAAILGLAKEMEPYRRGRYVAGLWEDSLVADLGWVVDGHMPRGTTRCRPTWSWTSISSICYYSPEWVDCDVEVISIDLPRHSTGQGSIPTSGPRDHGAITLRGKVYTGVSLDSQDHCNPKDGTWLLRSFGNILPSDRATAFYGPDIVFTTPLLRDGEPIFCLAIGFHVGKDSNFDCGLLLRCVDESAQLYERFGFIRVLGGGPDVGKREPGGGFDRFANSDFRTITLV